MDGLSRTGLSQGTLARAGLVALAYFALARLGLLLPYVGTHVTLIWLPTGIAVAALWRWGDRMLVGIFAGVALTYFSRAPSHPVTTLFLLGNTLAPWVTVQLLRRLAVSPQIQARRDVLALVAAAMLGMLVSAGIGAAALWAANIVRGEQLFHAWGRWWMGDVVGVLLAAPPLMLLSRRALRVDALGVRVTELAVCLLLALASAALAFLSPVGRSGAPSWLHGPMVFVPFLPLTWLAVRSASPLFPTLAVLFTAGMAALGTSLGLGPLGPLGDPHLALSVLWGYLLSLALVVLMLGAVASEVSQANERLQGLFLSSRDAILMGRPGGVIEAANEAARQLLGLDEDEIRRRGRDGVLDMQDPRLGELLQQRERLGSAIATVRVLRGDGSTVETECLLSRHVGRDGVVRSYGVLRDITDRLRVEGELQFHRDNLEMQVRQRTDELARANLALERARDAAESASRAKSVFLANMSHEIRTPLNAIIGLTHLLHRGDLPAQQREQLRKIGAAAEHLLKVINDVLDLSKIEAGRLELEHIDFSLGAVLSACREQMAGPAAGKGLGLHVESHGVPDALRGDPTRLTQALLNLLGNAVKFTEVGHVTLRVEALNADRLQPLLRFTVEDTGIGLDPTQLSQLFSAFTQADASTTRRFGGTGLGLSITRHLAERMGGEAGARSEPGRGSAFWFTAQFQAGQPAERRPSAAGPDAEQQVRARFAGARVLLAEDNPINREVAVALMEPAGLVVDWAANGVEAVEKARTGHYAVILMDMQMPGMDGLEATRAIRAMATHAATPIVAMTANAFGEDRLECLRAGMDDHLAKPVDPEGLFATLLRWLPKRMPAAGPTG